MLAMDRFLDLSNTCVDQKPKLLLLVCNENVIIVPQRMLSNTV
jgi:hypothetical protein